MTHRDPSRTAAAAHQQQQTTSASYGRPPIGSSGGSTPDHARPLMPTYGRTHPAPLHPPFQSSPSFHNHRTAEQLEAQNDDAIEGLSAKVRLLKDVRLLSLISSSLLLFPLIKTDNHFPSDLPQHRHRSQTIFIPHRLLGNLSPYSPPLHIIESS